MFNLARCFLPFTVILLTLGQCQAQEPVISMTSTETTLRSGAMFYFNCTVTPYNADWSTQVVKTMFEVTTPDGTKYKVGNESSPSSIAINGDINANLKSDEGDRYMAMHMGSSQDNMTKTTVVVNSTKPEDSGLWSCRVWKGNDVIKNTTDTVNLQVDGPVRYVKIYADATPGGTVLQNQTLSDGVPFTFLDKAGDKESHTYMVTCEVGVPSSTGPQVKVMMGSADITADFTKSKERSTSPNPKAGGLVVHTAHIPYVSSEFSPKITDHGKTFLCDVSLEGYSKVNASFTLNVESKPQIMCPPLVGALVDTKDTVITCSILANPPVTRGQVKFDIPEGAGSQHENVTVTFNSTGINSTLTIKIAHLTTDLHGMYNITAANVHGTTTGSMTLVNRIVTAASTTACSSVMATIISLALALVLQR